MATNALDLSITPIGEKVEGLIFNRGVQKLPAQTDTFISFSLDFSRGPVFSSTTANGGTPDILICYEAKEGD